MLVSFWFWSLRLKVPGATRTEVLLGPIVRLKSWASLVIGWGTVPAWAISDGEGMKSGEARGRSGDQSRCAVFEPSQTYGFIFCDKRDSPAAHSERPVYITSVSHPLASLLTEVMRFGAIPWASKKPSNAIAGKLDGALADLAPSGKAPGLAV